MIVRDKQTNLLAFRALRLPSAPNNRSCPAHFFRRTLGRPRDEKDQERRLDGAQNMLVGIVVVKSSRPRTFLESDRSRLNRLPLDLALAQLTQTRPPRPPGNRIYDFMEKLETMRF
jgi:hypothetical protein